MPAKHETDNRISRSPRWWGEYELEPGQWSRWIIGPKELLARTVGNEWRFAWKTSDDKLSEAVSFEKNIGEISIDAEYKTRRYALENAGPGIRIMPRLSNRAVIVRPETPLFLPSNERATLYVSTGVWLIISSIVEGSPELMEMPVYRGSDTWFGPNTVEGELCYSSITSARTDVSLLAQVPHRAITPIDISNNGSDSLVIESLRVPVPLLSIYAGARGQLWTDKISFEREQGESAASLRISEHETLETETKERLSGPRESEPSGIVHSFSRIFGKSEI